MYSIRKVIDLEVEKRVNIDVIRSLLEEGKSFTDIMKEVMVIGKKFADDFGHKDYNSPEEFFEDIKKGTSPLVHLDGEVETDVDNTGKNLVCVKHCPMKDLMKEMSSSGTSDAKVDTVMNGHMLREGEESNFVDVGCFVMQQLRQMMISSISVQGKYDLNYIHLGCDKGTGKRTISKGDVEALSFDEGKLNSLLDQCDCVYTISFKEGQE